MSSSRIFSTILLVLIAQVHSQFFDYFGIQPIAQNPKLFGTEFTTKRTRIEVIRLNQEPQRTWKNTTYTFSYDGIERDDSGPRETARSKKRKQTIPIAPTLLPIFNFYSTSTTQKPVRKTTKVTATANSSRRESAKKKSPARDVSSSHDVPLSKTYQSDWYDRPINNVADDYSKPSYEATTRPYNYNNYNNRVVYNANDFTTKSPIYNRPGVKPVVVDDRPPITNKPVTQRPYWAETQRPFRPETQRPFRPETQRPYRPETERPYRPATERPQTQRPTSKPTIKPYIVNPFPTQAGAVVFPHEDESPEIIKGPDEDYMSDAEKRRYIELSEKMCDKYKSLNTKQLAAIPLLPSPDPVSVNVSQCTPTQIPLVVGGKVVTINEFPHMALLGWVKIDGGGYSWKCGGSLISDRFVLTAAHCSYEERDNTVITGPPRVVQLGSSYLDDPGALVVRVAAVIRHPKYKFPRSYYDLAVLKLIQPVTFSEVIKPACLGVPPPVDQPIIATGWGKTEFGGDQSVELRSVSLPVWNMDKCKEILGTSRKMPQGAMRDSQLCAGEKRGGKDTCQGDSGGPAQLQDGCAWRVVAVTSLGRSCGAPNTPGLYALVQRAFIAAAVFGDYKNNQRRSDNSQSITNNNSYKANTNHRTTTESYPAQNDNVRQDNHRTTTTETYYNPPQDDYGRPNTNYKPASYDTDSNGGQNTQYNQNSNHRTTTTTESYYNRPQDDYGRPNTNYRPAAYDANFNGGQNTQYNQNSNHRTTTTTESYYNRPQDDYGRPNTNYRPAAYDANFNGGQNTQYNQNSNHRTTTTTESYYNRPQDDYGRPNTNYRPTSYDAAFAGQNTHKNTHSRPPNTDVGFYDQQRDRSDHQGYNRQQSDFNRRNVDRFEPGAVWFTK